MNGFNQSHIFPNGIYSADKAHLHQDYGLPGHFDMNFHKYQMEIELKLSDTPSLGHLAGQGVLHHLHQV